MVCKWAGLFKRSLDKDDPLEGRTKISGSTRNRYQNKGHDGLEHRLLTDRDLVEALGISLGTVSNILTEVLGFKKLVAAFANSDSDYYYNLFDQLDAKM